MAQPQGSLQDKESAAFIVDASDSGVNKRVQLMNTAFNPIANWTLVKVGNNIKATYPDSVTEVYEYREFTTVIYEITVVYTTSSKDILDTVTRTA
jgi:hypothetical protein